MTDKRGTVEVTADLCDGLFDLEASYPAEMGENLPLAQTLFEYNANGQLPLRIALEKGLGIENPEDVAVEIAVEQLMKTPQGQSILLGYAAQDAQDEALAELERAFAEGLVAQDGTPTAATAEITGGGVQPGGAKQQLGGIVAGAMETGPMNRDAMAAPQV